jgi:hypothetical protein
MDGWSCTEQVRLFFFKDNDRDGVRSSTKCRSAKKDVKAYVRAYVKAYVIASDVDDRGWGEVLASEDGDGDVLG